MRSTQDLIEELAAEAPRLTGVAIAVGFERRTEFVWHGQSDNPVAELNKLVRAGGEPVGLIGYVRLPGGEIRLYQRVFAEHAGESWVQDYFTSLMATTQLFAEKAGARTVPVKSEEN
jgi:hypothetical protein